MGEASLLPRCEPCFGGICTYTTGCFGGTLWLCQNSYWTCTIEIVDLPIQNGDVPSFFLGLPGRVNHPFRWLQLPTVGEISTSLSVFTGFMHQKKDMSNITEISKKNHPAWNVSSGGWILIIYPDVSHEISTKNISPEISPENGWIVFLES
jgi:hypothetical protein